MPPSDSAASLSPDRERAIRAIKVLLFSASIIPALVGGAAAAAAGPISRLRFVLATLGLFIGQAGGDYLYFHFTHFHTDPRDAHTKIFAGWRPLFTGWLLKPEQALHAGAVCLMVDLGIAIYFLTAVGAQILWFALAGGAVAVFFTPLMLRGLKEPVIFATFGPLCVSGMVFALGAPVSVPALVASVPVGLFITVVAHLKSARFDVVDEAGEQVVLKLSRATITGLFALGYVSLVLGVVLRQIPVWSLGALVSLPLAFTVISVVRESQSRVADYLWATVRSILVSVIVGVAIAAGFAASAAR
jgi:1,4-dihydroxy-2-naphthoate octaprenyltransferase